jgi:hypothetical protein
MFADRMMRGEKGSELQACHGVFSPDLFCFLDCSGCKLRGGKGQGNPRSRAASAWLSRKVGRHAAARNSWMIAPNWSVKAEYNYIKMFAQRVQLQGTAAGGPFGAGSAVDETASKVTQDLHLVKVGVNYHFNP